VGESKSRPVIGRIAGHAARRKAADFPRLDAADLLVQWRQVGVSGR
jgi:hypothetical protein